MAGDVQLVERWFGPGHAGQSKFSQGIVARARFLFESVVLNTPSEIR